MRHVTDYALIHKYSLESKFDKALEKLNQYIDLNPENKENYLLRGDIYYRLKEYTKALNDFSKVLQLDSNDTEAKLLHGIVYHAQQGKSDSVLIQFIDQIIKTAPENAMLYYYRGRIYKRMNQDQNALADYDKAIKLNPNESTYYHSRGFLFQSQSRYENAIVDFNRSIELNPNAAVYFHNRANSNFKVEKFEAALQDYNKAVEINPDDTDVRQDRAVAAAYIGNLQLALADYYYIKEENLNVFFSYLRNKFSNINTYKLLKDYHDIKNVMNKYQLNVQQSLTLLKTKDYVNQWLLQTWRQLVTGKDINNKVVALNNNTPALPPEVYRLITSFIMECSDHDLDKLVWAVNKRLYDDVTEAHSKKIGVKITNSANKFLTLFNIKTKPDNFQQIAEERFNKRLDF